MLYPELAGRFLVETLRRVSAGRCWISAAGHSRCDYDICGGYLAEDQASRDDRGGMHPGLVPKQERVFLSVPLVDELTLRAGVALRSG